ncbi:MAG TPA: glycoside hydrolase family 38 C-terminal domain-containing protein [Anaerolineaceae bacterium]
MALTEGWKRRLEGWQKAITDSVYFPLGGIVLNGFITKEQLPPKEAVARDFKPMPVGTAWGAKWEYGWFKGSVVLPEVAQGRRIVAVLDVGDESVVWVNGKEIGAIDFGHKEITLTPDGKAGERFDILLESYAGHGPREAGGGPVIFGQETIPEPGPTQALIKNVTFGVWREEVFQLAIDFITLLEARNSMDQNSLRVAEIDRGLMDASYVIDMELPEAEMLETVKAGRAGLKPLLECTNGSTAPIFYTFGHAHLDVEWLWPLAETERKMGRTVGTQLTLMEEYPEYKYLQSQPHIMRMLKNRYPDVYERFKAAVKSGNIIIEGGMWVEADTNITSGESLIRQFIHGKRYMQDEFGVDSRVLWLPDVFGYSGALPQIMAGCGIMGFMTSKIFWIYNGGDPFPYNNFTWEGIDGTGVLAHLYNGYGHFPSPADMLEAWNTRNQRNDISSLVHPIGWGDGGGGASREHLEFLRRARDFEGVPKVRWAGPVEYFQDMQAKGPLTNRYVGELYFQNHRGTYTTQAKTKKGNRNSEFVLREAEMWGVAARALKGFAFSAQTLDEAWKTVLLHQFHDALPGSSIHRVYEEIERDHAAVIAEARHLAEQAASQFATGSVSGATAFNSLSWPRTALVVLPDGATAGGPLQKIGSKTLVEVDLPACGWSPLPQISQVVEKPGHSLLKATPRSLENDYLHVDFNDLGEITSLVDKVTGRETAAGPLNSFKMYKDVPSWFDAWDIDVQYQQSPVDLLDEASLTLETAGPLVAKLKLTRALSAQSHLTQIISLRRGRRRIDFETTVEWQESHKLLKVAFPVTIHSDEAIHEIQFGHIHRPNHASRLFDADRFEVSNHKWSALAEANRGVAVLNDSKYGLNVVGNTINLTLLKSALAPDMTADKGTQTFTYALYPWNGSLAESDVVKEAYDLNVPAMVVKGSASQEVSLFSLDADNVIIETVKPAEDGSSRLVVRLYEAMHMTTACQLMINLPVKRGVMTDMLENTLTDLPISNGCVALTFHPFEIKTLAFDL